MYGNDYKFKFNGLNWKQKYVRVDKDSKQKSNKLIEEDFFVLLNKYDLKFHPHLL